MIMRVNLGTREANDRRANKIVYTMILFVVAITCYMIGDNSADSAIPTPTPTSQVTKIKSEVPRCDLEDGSTQEVCWWHDAANGRYLNINFGQYVYVPINDEMINWSE